MPYSAEISRLDPSCFVFLIDQSGSMQDAFGAGDGMATKADGVADAINRLLANLVIRCSRSEGVRDYFHVAVIGYGTNVSTALSGPLAGHDMVPLSEIADQPLRIEPRSKQVPDGAGGLVEQTVKFPVWMEPRADGPTPMCMALGVASDLCHRWIGEHPSSFPPVVLNITDGEATDGDPLPPSRLLTSIESEDGCVLLFNCHISSHRASPVEFPDSEPELHDKYAAKLYQMSSILPPHLQAAARKEGYLVTDSTRGYVFNAEIVSLVKFLDIGTRASNLR